MIYDAVIVGGGACGLMCGVQAGKLGKNVIILERNDRPGAKILISGGGRCNYTNLYSSSENFISSDPAFCVPVFSRWTVNDTVRFFEEQRIFGQEKTLGQLFPVSNKAKDVVAVFTDLLRKYRVELRTHAFVKAVRIEEDGLFTTTYEQNGRKTEVKSKALVMASGGLPVAKLGASDFALRTARTFGIGLVETAPALVPLTITGKDADWFAALSGNSVFSKVSTRGISFQENILFTHWGLSGPAILQLSSYWRPGEEIEIDLLPGSSIAGLIARERDAGGRKLLLHLFQDYFTKRFAEALGKFLPVDTKIASLGKKDVKKIVECIHHFRVKPAGDKGYDKAEVMRGGVSTDELHPDTLESRKVPKLYFGGECVDVTGWLGGYNFQWAWASGAVIATNL